MKTVHIDWICGKERGSLRDDFGGQICIFLGTELDSQLVEGKMEGYVD